MALSRTFEQEKTFIERSSEQSYRIKKVKVEACYLFRTLLEIMRNLLRSITVAVQRMLQGFVQNMNVEGIFYVNQSLEKLLFDELRKYSNLPSDRKCQGFLPAVKQIANVATLPGIVKRSIGIFVFFKLLMFTLRVRAADVFTSSR